MKHASDLLAQRPSAGLPHAPTAPARAGCRRTASTSAGYSLARAGRRPRGRRRALGYGRVDLLSESAGTRTAMIYAWRHPQSIHRSVMIGVNPPGHFLWYPRPPTSSSRKYAALVRQGRHLQQADGRPRRDAARRRRATSCRTAGGSCRSRRATSSLASFFGLMELDLGAAAPLSAPMTIDSWLVGRARRPERALVPVHACRSSCSPNRSGHGATSRRSAGIDAAAADRYFRVAGEGATRSSAAPARISSGPADSCRRPGRPSPDEQQYYSRCATRRCRRS